MPVHRAGTMVAVVHGDLRPHPWSVAGVGSSDAYSLFVARSSAMGWLADPAAVTPDGLWGMNDAGLDPRPTSRAAWFQVSLAEPVPAGRPLPVQPFLSCVDSVVDRIGTLHLRAVQLLLPVQSIVVPDPGAGDRPPLGALAPLLQDAGWFADHAPGSATPVRVTLDSGQDRAVPSAAPGILRRMRMLGQSVFRDSTLVPADRAEPGPGPTDHTAPDLESSIIDEVWGGPARHRATVHGTLAEWSLEAAGWLAAILADACAHSGVTCPVLLTVVPTAPPTDPAREDQAPTTPNPTGSPT